MDEKTKAKIAHCYKAVARMFPHVYYTYKEAEQDFLIVCFLKNKTAEEVRRLELMAQMYKSCAGMTHRALCTYHEEKLYDEDGNCLDYVPVYFDDPLQAAERKEKINKILQIIGNGKGAKYLLAQAWQGLTSAEIAEKEGVKRSDVSNAIYNVKLKIKKEVAEW